MKFLSFGRLFGDRWLAERVPQKRRPKPRRTSARPKRARLSFDTLEDRTVPSTIPTPIVANSIDLSGTGDTAGFIGTTNHNTPSIAVDPVNPQKVVAVWTVSTPTDIMNPIKVEGKYSNDGGQTWVTLFQSQHFADPTNAMGNPLPWVTDASVAFDGADQVYVLYSAHEQGTPGTAGGQFLVLDKWDFKNAQPMQVPLNPTNKANPNDNIVFQAVQDLAISPTLAVDANPALGNGQGVDQFSGNVYIAWATNDAAPTNVPATVFNPNVIRIMGSSDGGFSFGAQQVVNATGNLGGLERDVRPRIAISNGTANGIVAPGQLDIVWDNFGTESNPPSGPPVSIISLDRIPTGLSGGSFNQPTAMDINSAGGGVTMDPVTVATGSNFGSLTDVTVTVNILWPNLTELKIELVSPTGKRVTLLNNRVDATGTTISTTQGTTGANMGILAGTRPVQIGTTFDDSAARSIVDTANGASAPFAGHYRPEQRLSGILSPLTGLTKTDVDGVWNLVITDVRADTTATPKSILNWTLTLNSGFTVAHDVGVPFHGNTVDGIVDIGALNANYRVKGPVTPTFGFGPSIAIASDNTLDNTAAGLLSPHRGRLYMVYTNTPRVPTIATDSTDIYMITSDDGGKSWTNPVIVNDDAAIVDGFSGANQDPTKGPINNRPHFMPEVAVDQATGTVLVSWYDARNDPARTRVARYFGVSIDGGRTFSPQTFFNRPATAFDQVTQTFVTLTPTPDNISTNNPNADQQFGFGDHQGLAIANGRIYAVWTGNLNGGTDGKALLDIEEASATYAAGPRIISSTMGPVQPGVFSQTASDGTLIPNGFQVTFDRPVNPSTFTIGEVKIQFTSPTGTIVSLSASAVTPLNSGAFGATQFAVSFDPTPVAAANNGSFVGTYSYSVGPDITDGIPSPITLLTPVVPSPNPFTSTDTPLPVPVSGTGGTGDPSKDDTVSMLTVGGIPDGQVISHLSVSINIAHPSDSDLLITLIAPSGAAIILAGHQQAGANYGGASFDTTFDDNAGQSITSGAGPFAGTFRPLQPLSSLRFQNPNGTWMLKIEDSVQFDSGTLRHWSLQFDTGVVGSSFRNGNMMDQNANGLQADNPGDIYSNPRPLTGTVFQAPFDQNTLPIIVPGPRIVSSSVVGGTGPDNLVVNGTVSGITVVFDRDMLPFDGSKIVRVMGPAGLIGPFNKVFHTGTAQGGDVQSIVLDSQASAVDNIYNNDAITILSGTGAGQTRVITQYSGSTQTATVQTPWTIVPDNTSVFNITPQYVTQVNARTFTINFLAPDGSTPLNLNLSGTYTVTLAASIQSTVGDMLDTNQNAGVDFLRDTPSSGTQPVVYRSTSGPLAIGSVDKPTTTDSFITVPDTYVLEGITVGLDITYPHDPDLQATLTAPDGTTSVLLFSQVGNTGSGASFTNTRLNDSAPTPITSGAPPFTGLFAPQTPLDTQFVGLQVNGTWKLEIKDLATGTVGTLNNWSLTFLKPIPGTGLGEQVADQTTVSFRVFTTDPTNALSHTTWTSVGPAAIDNQTQSGIIGAIAVDPSDPSGNTVYVGGSSGGVWKTTNFLTTEQVQAQGFPTGFLTSRGPTYVPLTDFGPNSGINVGSIAVFGRNHDTNQSIVIAATGFGDGATPDGSGYGRPIGGPATPGVGFLRSTDGGATWTLLDSAVNVDANGNLLPESQRGHEFVGTWAFKVLVDPRPTPSGKVIIYAALSGPANDPNVGVWRSTDTGDHWQQMRKGQATDIVFDPNSGSLDVISDPTGNLEILFAAFAGDGIYVTPNQGQVWNLMSGTTGDPLILNGDDAFPPPVPVVAWPSPNGAKGRIVLAKPDLTGVFLPDGTYTGNPIQDLLYEGWLYALVITPTGVTDGLYVTKDFGQNWTHVDIRSLKSPTGHTTLPTNDPTQDPYSVTGSIVPTGNFAASVGVDPNNPNIVYIGGKEESSGLLRVDVTAISDAHAFFVGNNKIDGRLAINSTDSVTLEQWPLMPGVPNPVQNPEINLLRNPADPFNGTSTNIVRNTKQFNNTGTGATWVPFDLPTLTDSVANTSSLNEVHRMLVMRDPITGNARIIIGADQGVVTGVDNNGSFDFGIGSASTASGARNGNLQITNFFYGASQPSDLAAQIAGALFYGVSSNNGNPQSDPNVLDNGNLNWGIPAHGEGAGHGIATDQTGAGTLYLSKDPGQDGQNAVTDFFQVTPTGGTATSRTFGLIQVSNPTVPPDPQWPLGPSFHFAVNPIDGNEIIISSAVGRIFGTIDQGRNWLVIGDPVRANLDGTNDPALAFGSPQSNDPTGALNDFLYAGSNGGHIYVTFKGGGAQGDLWINISNGLDGSPVEEIIPDPTRDKRDAYAVTTTGVFYLPDAALPNATWQPVSGNLAQLKHNPFSFDGPTVIVRTGTAQAGTGPTITLDPNASTMTGLYNGDIIAITAGTGAGQIRTITSYIGSTQVATVDSAWTVVPDSTSVFAVATVVHSGTAQAGTGSTITLDAGASAVDNFYQGEVVAITGGQGAAQNRTIISYVGSTRVAILSSPWTIAPDSSSQFSVVTVVHTGTAQAGTGPTITLDAGASATDNQYQGDIVTITAGTGAGQKRNIISYVGSSRLATVDSAWTVVPDSTSVFTLTPDLSEMSTVQLDTIQADWRYTIPGLVAQTGTAQGGGPTAVTLNVSASSTDNRYQGDTITITGGTGAGQTRTIVSYVGSTQVATVDSAWTTIPDKTSTFSIRTPTFPVLYVGGISGVYRSLDHGTTWTVYPDVADDGAPIDGGYLPNVEVSNLQLVLGNIDPTTGHPVLTGNQAGADILVATTFGRGTFAIRLSPVVIPASLQLDANLPSPPGTSDNGVSGTDKVTSVLDPVIDGFSEITALGNRLQVQLFDLTGGKHVEIGQIVPGFGSNGISTTDGTGKFEIQVAGPSITLDAAASTTDNLYKGAVITITGGTGAGQTKTITSYVGSTQIATVDSPWSVVPDSTSTFSIAAAGHTGTAQAGSAGYFKPDGSNDGLITLGIVLTDPATGVVSGTAMFTYTLNTMPTMHQESLHLDPNRPLPASQGGSDSGRSATDLITNVLQPVIDGRVDQAAPLTVQLVDTSMGNAVVGSGMTDALGNFSVQVNSGVYKANGSTDGPHILKVIALHGPTPSSGTFTFTLDTTPPVRPAAPTLDPADQSAGAPANNTNIATPDFLGKGEANAEVELFAQKVNTNGTLGAVTLVGTDTVSAQGNYRVQVSTQLADGTYNITVDLVDVAGNTSQMSPALKIVKTRPPTPPAPTLDPADQNSNAPPNNTDVTTPDFLGTAQPNSTIELFAQSVGSNGILGTVKLVGTDTVDAQGKYRVQVINPLVDGTYNITVDVVDNFGDKSLMSAAMSPKLVIQTKGPNKPTITLDPAFASVNSTTAAVTPQVYDGTADPGTTVSIVDNGVTIDTFPETGATFSRSENLGDGTHNLVVLSTDLFGHVTQSDELSITVNLESLDPDRKFVRQLYADNLGRAGSLGEWNLWLPALSQPNGRNAVASAIARSPEARDLAVRGWYQTYLGRQANNGEEAPWVNALLAGATEEQVVSGILSSNEYFQRTPAILGIGGQPSNSTFIQALYVQLLNRKAGAAEVSIWLPLVTKLGRGQVALMIYQSQESRGDVVSGYYANVLRRPTVPAPSEVASWVFSGLDFTSIRVGFEGSDEYFFRVTGFIP